MSDDVTSDSVGPFPELWTAESMSEFLRSRGFKPGPSDGNPPEVWFNGVPYQHPGTFWREGRRDWGAVTGPARMTAEVEQIKTDPDAYYQQLRAESDDEVTE